MKASKKTLQLEGKQSYIYRPNHESLSGNILLRLNHPLSVQFSHLEIELSGTQKVEWMTRETKEVTYTDNNKDGVKVVK
jgi:hypothetical protein